MCRRAEIAPWGRRVGRYSVTFGETEDHRSGAELPNEINARMRAFTGYVGGAGSIPFVPRRFG